MDPLSCGFPPHQGDGPEHKSTSKMSCPKEPEPRTQPWKKYLAEIAQESEEYKKNNSIDTDYFKVSEGFNDHSMSG